MATSTAMIAMTTRSSILRVNPEHDETIWPCERLPENENWPEPATNGGLPTCRGVAGTCEMPEWRSAVVLHFC